MAVTIEMAPERWLRGMDRLVAGAVEMLPSFSMPARRQNEVSARWVMERGPVRTMAPVDVLGGFPGSLESANRFQGTTVLVTSRYLVVGEGTAGGFALPIADVLAAGIVRPSRQTNPGLVIRYQDGSSVGAFALDFRGLARGLSGRHRAEEVLLTLEELGVQRLASSRIPGAPALVLSWSDAQHHDPETLIWAGRAVSSVGGWYGAVQRECRVWLTEESLFWCCSHGNGVNRLPIPDIIDVRDGVADRICLAFRDGAGQRYDLVFDLQGDVSRTSAAQQRMQLLNALASVGVPVGTAPRAMAPWRRGGMMRPTDLGR